MSRRTHLVIGAGRMGGALMSGWVLGQTRSLKPDALVILDPNPGDAAKDIISHGALHVQSPDDIPPTIEYVLLAIKPQMLADLGPAIAKSLPRGCVLISILAGSTLSKLKAVFPNQTIIRAMPNTPAAIGAGITAFTYETGVSSDQTGHVHTLLSAGGAVHEVGSEHLIDVVTAVSGSGPAYIFHMVEALEAAAIEIGLPDDIATDFARQTIIGASELLKHTDTPAGELRKAVTSPNGTTQAALNVLMDVNGLATLMSETVNAALKRAKELGSEP